MFQTQDMMVEAMAKTAVLPVVVSAGLGFALAKWRAPFLKDRDWQAGLALSAGICAAFFAFAGFREFPPKMMSYWLPFLTLPALITFTAAVPFPKPVRAAVALLSLAGLIYHHMHPLASFYEGSQVWLYMGAVWLIAGAWMHVWDRPAGTMGEAKELLVLVVAAAACSLVAVNDGSAFIGQAAGLVSASVGGLFLARVFGKDLQLGFATVGIFFVCLTSLWINAYFYAEVDLVACLLGAAVPLVLFAKHLPFYKGMNDWKQGAFLVGLAVIPAAIAVIKVMTATESGAYDY